MWYSLVLFLVTAALLIGISSCIPGRKKSAGFTENDSLFFPADTTHGKSTRQDIETRLKALAESEVPKNLNPGAMCYEMAAPPDYAVYVCPKCGQKTMYARTEYFHIVDEAQECRNAIANIPGLDLRLEEKNFCHACDPDTTQAPQLNLAIRYKGENQEEIISGVNAEDLALMYEFMNGDKTHAYFNEREEPLKDYLDRLERLLSLHR